MQKERLIIRASIRLLSCSSCFIIQSFIFTGIGHEARVDVEKVFKPVTISSGNSVYIMFDLETTSLSKSTSSTFLLTFRDTKASEILLDFLVGLLDGVN